MNKWQIDFGDYVDIEQKRHGVPNEMYLHKVVRALHSTSAVEVPVQCPAKETHQEGIEPVIACICCGIDETKVLNYRLADVTKTQRRAFNKVGGVI